MKRFSLRTLSLMSVMCLLVMSLATLPARATGVTLPDIGIDATDYTSGLATSVGPWIAGGLAVGVVILAVILGYRKFKTVAK